MRRGQALRHPDRSAPRLGLRFAVGTGHLCQIKFWLMQTRGCPVACPGGSWGYLSLGRGVGREGEARELLSDHPQLVFRADFVELVDHPDQRADMLLGPLKELLASLGLHQTSCSRTATVGHDQPSLRTETKI